MNFALVETVYLVAGVLAFLAICSPKEHRESRIPSLLVGLTFAAIHLACLEALTFSYLDTTWTYPGSSYFNLMGHGLYFLFFIGAMMAVLRCEFQYVLLFFFLIAFNIDPNDQEYAIQSMGVAGWMGSRLLVTFGLLAAISAIGAAGYGLYRLGVNLGWIKPKPDLA